MEIVIANLSGKVRRAKRSGRDYLVAPITMIVPGVLDGSDGPLYYPPEELGANPSDWNGMPIVLEHPVVNGIPVSARTPEILDQSGMGEILNTNFHSSLISEGWFDIESTRRVSLPTFLDLVEGRKIEVSTGLGAIQDTVSGSGTHNGRPYKAIARRYKPDHLAVLRNGKGACSIYDGCGVLANQPSHSQLRMQLYKLLESMYSKPQTPSQMMMGYSETLYPSIVDVFDKYFVYEVDGKLYKLNYVTDLRTDLVTLKDEAPTEVSRRVSYKPVSNSGEDMSKLTDNQKKEHVDYIVANCDCWKGDKDKDILNGFPDEKILSIRKGVETSVANEQKRRQLEATIINSTSSFEQDGKVFTFNKETGKWDSKAKEPPVTPPAVPTPPALSPEQLNLLNWASQEMTRQKQELVTKILTANTQLTDEPTRQRLAQKLMNESIEDLKDRLLLVPTPAPAATPTATFPFFPGPGAPLTNQSNEDEEDVLVAPRLDYKEMATQNNRQRA